jgi:protein-tyrosine phosphatase
MIKTAARYGTPIEFLRARQFNVKDFQNFDHILVMDQSNFKNVLALAKNAEERNKIKFLLDFMAPDQQLEVPDPYYGTQQDFDAVYELLDRATDALIQKLFHEY